MAKKTQQPAEQTGTNSPDFIAYTVINRSGEEDKGKAIWRAIGSAWVHNDRKGFQLRLDAFPIDGVVTLRAPLPPKGDA
jgi:hypothetical protein